MRVATWNMKQVAPRQPLDERWRWMAEEIAPDVIVLTEAKVPEGGPPQGWEALWVDGGMGPRRRWGTVIAGRGVELREINHVSRAQGTVLIGLETTWPAAVRIAGRHEPASRSGIWPMKWSGIFFSSALATCQAWTES